MTAQDRNALLDELTNISGAFAMLDMMFKEELKKSVAGKACAGRARVLGGNPGTIGKRGGFFRANGPFSGITVRKGTAAIIPRQFTGAPFAGPKLRAASFFIRGITAGGQRFSGVSDTVGNDELKVQLGLQSGLDVQEIILKRNSGLLILELVSGREEGIVDVEIFVPSFFSSEFGCPEGTTPAGGP